jgi:hypothetical protein
VLPIFFLIVAIFPFILGYRAMTAVILPFRPSVCLKQAIRFCASRPEWSATQYRTNDGTLWIGVMTLSGRTSVLNGVLEPAWFLLPVVDQVVLYDARPGRPAGARKFATMTAALEALANTPDA